MVCGPYFVPVVQQPHDLIGAHQQYHPNTFPLSSTIIRPRSSPRLDKLEKSGRIISSVAGEGDEPVPPAVVGGICTADIRSRGAAVFEVAPMAGNSNKLIGNSDQETLPLFPVSPTGILQGKEDNPHNCSSYNNVADTNTSSISNPSSSSEVEQEGCPSGHDDRPFFDFFSR